MYKVNAIVFEYFRNINLKTSIRHKTSLPKAWNIEIFELIHTAVQLQKQVSPFDVNLRRMRKL